MRPIVGEGFIKEVTSPEDGFCERSSRNHISILKR